MQKLIDLNRGEMLERGVFPSLADNQQELWKVCSNVDFQSRRARKALGHSIENAGAEVISITQAFVDDIQRAYFAERTKVFVYSNGVRIEIGSGFDPNNNNMSLEPWGKFLLATNGIDAPKIWKNTGVMVDLGGLTGVRAGRKYKLFKKHKNHMLGYFGQQAEWSSESDVELWEPATNNSAGGQFLRDLDSNIVAVAQLGPDKAIYSGDSLIIQRYIGEPFYFSFEPALDGVGAVSDSAIIPVGNRNFGMSRRGFFETDGISFDYIDNPQINDWVMGRFYPPQASRTVGVNDEATDTAKWWFLGEALQRYGVGYNYKKRTWTILDQPISAAAERLVFDSALIGTPEGFGFLSGYNADEDPMEAELETFPLDGGTPDQWKRWDVYRANFEGDGLQVRFGFSEYADEAPEWTAWAPIARENYVDRESVFLRIGLRSTALDASWALTGFTVHGNLTAYVG